MNTRHPGLHDIHVTSYGIGPPSRSTMPMFMSPRPTGHSAQSDRVKDQACGSENGDARSQDSVEVTSRIAFLIYSSFTRYKLVGKKRRPYATLLGRVGYTTVYIMQRRGDS